MPGQGFAGQANGGDAAVFDAHPFTDGATRIVIGQHRPLDQAQLFVDGLEQLRFRGNGAGSANQQRGTLTASQAQADVGKRLTQGS
ncbi:hypothetical protein D9M68_995870 [compost metagenome]